MFTPLPSLFDPMSEAFVRGTICMGGTLISKKFLGVWRDRHGCFPDSPFPASLNPLFVESDFQGKNRTFTIKTERSHGAHGDFMGLLNASLLRGFLTLRLQQFLCRKWI
ncbi:MAG: hypothetical protein HQL86_08385 [Magnetococcales bacterium]|nr:hypothetical protein [Magnetococcales bacterium]